MNFTQTFPLRTRGLSIDNRINIIIGVLTIVIGILSTILAWATWRLTHDRHVCHARHSADLPTSIPPRGLSLDNRINLIIGIMTIIIGVLGTLLAWATWRLTHIHHRLRHRISHDEDAVIESKPLQELPAPPKTTSAHLLGYELAFRIGRSR
ncbi:hypothetical protein BDZ45DRAFT_796630 [Acephala macrosclerotiorum]|nr:hypothetical protein BDZ45DRAFT_796630 [Acephala macrosclerotiorum]